MLANSSAAYPATWWQLAIQATILFGLLLFLIGEGISFLGWILRGVALFFRPSTYQTIYYETKAAKDSQGENRDPTRPRQWDDVEGKTKVAERMRHLTNHPRADKLQ